jgi:hypothetical protein
MKRGSLSEYFRGVAAKTLSAVEADPGTSNQHEFNGVSRLKSILGLEKLTIPARFVYLSDEVDSLNTADGFLTWYDARVDHPTRSEHRLYFPTSSVSQKFKAGDLLLFGLRQDGSALCVIAEGNSTSESQIRWLFGLTEDVVSKGFSVSDEAAIDSLKLEYASRLILDEIGVEPAVEPASENLLDKILEKFGSRFPPTRAFSSFVRELADLDPRDGADEVLMGWMNLEEAAFRALERHVISERLLEGFGGVDDVDVDGFIGFSLGVQNRRKSRAGYALENHLEAVFETLGVRNTRTAVTENQNKPDFVFPGVIEYRDSHFPSSRLTMLAAKTSAKDRWRQIVGEADRISTKHLITLEPSISENQTNEMKARQVSLVLPRSIHASYTIAQQPWLMDLEMFVELVIRREQG